MRREEASMAMGGGAVSFMLTCPNCGPRGVDEFRYGGEIRPRPEGDLTPAAWAAYLYERTNVAGPQHEWWYHRQGCRRWFVARRDTRTNTVLETGWYGSEEGAEDGQEHDAFAAATSGERGAGP
jgi:sarcosine oxidase subunit delta